MPEKISPLLLQNFWQYSLLTWGLPVNEVAHPPTIAAAPKKSRANFITSPVVLLESI
jgi:hypothetical protein